jgi:AcrR family transcriptional regulator
LTLLAQRQQGILLSMAPRFTRLEHDERRAQILICARRLFSGHHYGEVSLARVAGEAGVTRGLLHHYFGTKRELYVEVVRSMVTPPADLLADEHLPVGDRDLVLRHAVDLFLDAVRANRETWLATVGAQGFGRDAEVEAVLEQAREATAARVIELVRPGARSSPELRAAIRAYAGFAEAASIDWLQRRRLTRAQIHELLFGSLVALVDDVVPAVESSKAVAA